MGGVFESVMSITIFGGFIWFAILAVLLFIGLITSEVTENGYWAAFYFAVFTTIFYFWGNVPLNEFFSWENVGYYIAIGFMYAIIRTFFFGRTQQQKLAKYVSKGNKAKNFEKEDIKEHIFRWWFLWPVSLLTWTFTDLFRKLFDIVYQVVEKFFHFVISLGERTVVMPTSESTEIVVKKEKD